MGRPASQWESLYSCSFSPTLHTATRPSCRLVCQAIRLRAANSAPTRIGRLRLLFFSHCVRLVLYSGSSYTIFDMAHPLTAWKRNRESTRTEFKNNAAETEEEVVVVVWTEWMMGTKCREAFCRVYLNDMYIWERRERCLSLGRWCWTSIWKKRSLTFDFGK